MDANLVSIVTPTWHRPKELERCIRSVFEQSYVPLEHIIIGDGEDESVWVAFGTATYLELGHHWSSPETGPGVDAVNVGIRLARGAYVMVLADDDWLEPDAVAKLVAALEREQADFAYSRVHMVGRSENPDWAIGEYPPSLGCIGNALAKWQCHQRVPLGYPNPAADPDHPCNDWAQYSGWLTAGFKAAFVPEVLHHHTVNH